MESQTISSLSSQNGYWQRKHPLTPVHYLNQQSVSYRVEDTAHALTQSRGLCGSHQKDFKIKMCDIAKIVLDWPGKSIEQG